MARFAGAVGYGDSVETSPGIWEDVISEERQYFGDIIRNARRLDNAQNVNFDISVNNSISIIADEFANERFQDIRYVRWAGTLWIVTSVEVRRPRLILELGGVYNGPTP